MLHLYLVNISNINPKDIEIVLLNTHIHIATTNQLINGKTRNGQYSSTGLYPSGYNVQLEEEASRGKGSATKRKETRRGKKTTSIKILEVFTWVDG